MDPRVARRGAARLVGCLVFFAALPVTAEEVPRPKIGLALAGGGAKGAAHVGVLEVLEELRVPVDYIAGTSMGSIIGGLYATGLSAEELAARLQELDWDDLLRDEPLRRDLTFRRKEEDSRYLFDLEVGLSRKGLRFPGGLISGQKLFFELQKMTLGVAGIRDFDDLPIPFRTVATDVESGEMVVLAGGDLATAIRASMSLPGVFAPVELDGRLLMDGGMVDNVPVDIVRQMGADIVIAVDLGVPMSETMGESMVDVLQQSMRLLTRSNMRERLLQADLVLLPEVGEFGTMDFKSVAEIIPRGVVAAEASLQALSAFSVDSETYEQLRRSRPAAAAETVEFVRFEGNRRVDDRIVEAQVRLSPGAPRDLDPVSEDLGRIYGLGDFERVEFTWVEEDGAKGVVYRLHEKPWGPNYGRMALSLETDLDGELDLGVLVNLTSTRLNRLGAEWRNDLRIGGTRELASEFYQPLDFAGRWFVAPSLRHALTRPGVFVEGREVGELDVTRTTAAVDLGLQLGVAAEIRLGVEVENARVRVASGALPPGTLAGVDLEDIDIGGLSLEARVDRLDRALFPRRGSRARLRAFRSLSSLGADATYEKIELRWLRVASIGESSFLAVIEGGWSTGGEIPVYEAFTLGGFASLSGFSEDELRGQAFGVVRGGYYRRAWGPVYLGGWLEKGNVWRDESAIDFDTALWAATVLAGLETAAGPLYVGIGQAEGGENKVYISIGRTF